MRNKVLFIFMALAFISCRGAGNGRPEEPERPPVPAPVPEPGPEIESNVFIVEFFSALKTEGLFSHIDAPAGKRPLFYIFDGISYTPGTGSALINAARDTHTFPYFVQESASRDGRIDGLGMLTPYPISNLDGVCSEVHASGMTVRCGLEQSVDITAYVTRLESGRYASMVLSSLKTQLGGDGVLIGLVKSSEAEAVGAEAEKAGMSFSIKDEGCSYSLFAITNPGFVARGFVEESGKNLKWTAIRIEKLFK